MAKSLALRIPFLCSVFLTAVLLFPDPCAALTYGGLGEIRLVVQGNKRTKAKYIGHLFENCLIEAGPEGWGDLVPEELAQCLVNSKIFSKVRVEVMRPEIRISVEDRWTLIPVPYFSTTGNSTTGGGYVFDSNFTGRGKILGVGGALSSEGNTYMLFYFDPSLFLSRWTAAVVAGKDRTDLYEYAGDKKFYGHLLREASFDVYAGYQFTPLLNGSLSVGFTERNYEGLNDYPHPGFYDFMEVGATMYYKNADYKLYYSSGVTSMVEFTRQVERSDGREMSTSIEATLDAGFEVRDSQALLVGINGYYASGDDPRDAATVGYEKGFRGVQRDGIWARHAFSLSLDYHVPVWKNGYMTMTVAPFLDFGLFDPFDDRQGDSYAAYGAGAYLYLKKISFPGFGFVVGNNADFMGNFFMFFIGADIL